jgi:hypothetical protein
VAHCGRSTGGDYIYSLSTVDIATNWSESPGDFCEVAVRPREKLARNCWRPLVAVRSISPGVAVDRLLRERQRGDYEES